MGNVAVVEARHPRRVLTGHQALIESTSSWQPVRDGGERVGRVGRRCDDRVHLRARDDVRAVDRRLAGAAPAGGERAGREPERRRGDDDEESLTHWPSSAD